MNGRLDLPFILSSSPFTSLFSSFFVYRRPPILKRRKIPTKKFGVKQVKTCKLNRKTASENRFFSFVQPLGSKKRKDEAVEIEIFGFLATDIVENCVTLSFR